MIHFNLSHFYLYYESVLQKRQRFKVGLGTSQLLELKKNKNISAL